MTFRPTTTISLALGVLLACTTLASAATYKLPITGGKDIFKVWVDGGSARRVGNEGDVYIYDVTMQDDRCIAEITVQPKTNHGNSPKLTYDVCSEEGFELRTRRTY
jgi:hypothetical protein